MLGAAKIIFVDRTMKKLAKKHEVLDFSAPCFRCVLFKGCLGRERPSLAELFEIIPEPEDEEDYDGEDDD